MAAATLATTAAFAPATTPSAQHKKHSLPCQLTTK